MAGWEDSDFNEAEAEATVAGWGDEPGSGS